MIKGTYVIQIKIDAEIFDKSKNNGLDIIQDKTETALEIFEGLDKPNDGISIKVLNIDVSKV